MSVVGHLFKCFSGSLVVNTELLQRGGRRASTGQCPVTSDLACPLFLMQSINLILITAFIGRLNDISCYGNPETQGGNSL